MCYLWSEICSGPDYLGSDISSIPVIQNWWWRHNLPRKVSTDFPRFKAEYKGRGEKRKWTSFCINTTENKPTTHRDTFHSLPNLRKSVMKSTSIHRKKNFCRPPSHRFISGTALRGGDIEGVTGPCLPHKNFNRSHTRTNSRKAYLWEVLQAWYQEVMQCRAVGYRQVETMSTWTIKYTLRVSLKISCLQSIYMIVISAKYSFISLLLHFN